MVKPRVMYVDDSPANLTVFRHSFDQEYNITTVESGARALEQLAIERFDVVIADQRMPEMTGVELFELMRDRYPDVARVLVTAHSDQQVIVDAINRGKIYHYCQKPWDHQEIRLVIRNAMRANRINEQFALSEARLREAQAVARVGSWELNHQTKELYWSEEIYRIFDRDMASYRPTLKSFLQTVHDDDREEMIRAFEVHLSQRMPYDMVHRIVLDHDVVRVVRERCETTHGPTGEPLRSVGTVQDITDLHEAERALRLTQHAVDHSGTAIIRIIPSGHIEYANRAALVLLNCDDQLAAELKVSDIDATIAPEEWPALYEQIRLNRDVQFETMIHQRKGEKVPAAVRASVLEFAGEEYIFGFLEDLSERKREEAEAVRHQEQLEKLVRDRTSALEVTNEELQKSERQHRQLIENLHSGVLVYAPDTTIILVNPLARNLLGIDEKQIMGKKASEPAWFFVREDGSPMPYSEYPVNEVIRTQKELKNCIMGIKRPELRDVIWVLVNAYPELSANGELRQVVVTFVDVTDRRMVEEELRKLLRAVESSPVTVIITDTKGTIEYVNPNFNEVTGYPISEAIGQNPRFLKSGVQSTEFYRDLWKTITAGENWSGELCNKKKSGDIFWESVSISPVRDASGVLTHFVAVKTDISEKRRINLELEKAKEAAEAASKAKGEFLANMSHEIRTPMNALIGMTHLLQRTPLNAQQAEYIDKMGRASKSLLGIINDILDFSKIEAGKVEIEHIAFTLTEVIDNVLSIVGMKAEEKGVALITEPEPNVPTRLLGDPLRLGQVLLNLTNNAVKFTDQGQIVISTELASRVGDDVTLRFTVRDTGIGMTETQLDRLFLAFSQADASMTRKFGGTGLGLSICKGLVEMMGGQIGAESKEGNGSTFYFTAQFEAQRMARLDFRPPDHKLQGLKILLVDDNVTSRLVLGAQLEKLGFNVVAVESGIEAIITLKAACQPGHQPFKLMIVDWQMSGIDGIETLRLIREDDTIAMPMTIMATAHGREDIMHKAKEVNVDAFLIKPIAQSVLYDTIMQLVGSQAPELFYRHAIRSTMPGDLTKAVDGRILVVEDNDINQDVARDLLEEAGLSVSIVDNGLAAVELLTGGEDQPEFDLVLMDLQMPVMDGFEATRRIRQFGRYPSLPILAMTADALEGVREKVAEAGMNDYIPKPIHPAELYSKIKLWMDAAKEQPSSAPLASPYHLEPDFAIVDSPSHGKTHWPRMRGIDVAAGLASVGHNADLYRRLLTKFRNSHAGTMDDLTSVLRTGDLQTAARIAHTVKGLARTIGAQELAVTAAQLERAINSQTNSSTLLVVFGEALRTVLSSLALLDVLPATERKPVTKTGDRVERLDKSQIERLIQELAGSLAEDDLDAIQTFEKLGALLREEGVDDELEALARHAGQYEFGPALDALRLIASKLSITMEK